MPKKNIFEKLLKHCKNKLGEDWKTEKLVSWVALSTPFTEWYSRILFSMFRNVSNEILFALTSLGLEKTVQNCKNHLIF